MYQEFDAKVRSGALKVSKPWRALATPRIIAEAVDTPSHLQSLADQLWTAKGTRCGLPNGCKVKGTRRVMYFCEACREWLHLSCCADQRGRPADDVPYLCPLHTEGTVLP